MLLIEETNKRTLQAAKFWELSNLRFRYIQVYDNHLQKGAEGEICGMAMPEFLNRYVQLRLEMAKRSIPNRGDTDLDRLVSDRIRKRAIWTIDIPGMSDIQVAENFISLTGEFVRDPKGAETVTIVAKAEAGMIPEEIEKQIIRAVAREAEKDGEILYQPAGPEETSLPVFDLILRAKPRTKKIMGMRKDAGSQDPELEKAAQGMEPTTTEEFHRVPVQPYKPNGKLRFFWISEEKGIKCLEDMSRKMALAFLFTVDKWTMAEAKAWVKKFKEEKLAKAAAEVASWSPDTKTWSDAELKEREAEDKLIQENRKTAEAKNSHKFQPAKYPWWDGSTRRCLVCGDREPIEETCPGTETDYSTWSKFYDLPARNLANLGKSEDKQETSKADPDEQPKPKLIASKLRLGKGLSLRIQKIEAKKQMAGGIIYEPDTVDTQDDYTDAEEITEAKERFMEKYGKDPKRIKVMHKGKAFFFPVIESFQPEFDTKKGNGIIKAGAWWMMVKITDPEIWASVEKGELQGFSMGGRARSTS